MRLKVKVLFLSALLATLFTACAAQAPKEPVSITIDMTEYAFNPSQLSLKAGQQVTLNLTNSGALNHEITFGRTVELENNRPAGYEEDLFEVGGVEPEVTAEGEVESMSGMAHGGFHLALIPGGTATITFDVTEEMEGEWEIGCFEQEGVHYDAGMKGSTTVSP